MKISQNGINLIKKFEGCVLQVYLDPIGVKTVGYGHTGADINLCPVGARISQEQANIYLEQDLARFEANVNKYDSAYHWSQNEYDALVSFAFNVGSIDQLTAKGTRTKQEIANKMLEYNKAGGKPILTYRRQLEQKLFLSGYDADMTYVIGNTYTLLTGLYVREEPYGERKKLDSLTINAKRSCHFDSYGYAILDKGTRVTCKGVRKVDNSTWIEIPSGWICARENEDRYIE